MESYAQLLLDALKELDIIDEQRLTQLFAECQQSNASFQEKLLAADLISDHDLGKTVAEILGLPFIDLSSISIPSSLVPFLPEQYARMHKLLPFQENEEEVMIAFANPSAFAALQPFLQQKAQKKISPYYATERDVERSLRIFKQNLQVSYEDLLKEQVIAAGKSGANEAPIEKIVDILFEYAYDNGASDIHIEPEKDLAIVRFRVDGIMQRVLHFTPEIHTQVISRIKFLAKLRTDEHLSAQDGKIQLETAHEELDVRVSLVPIVHGEKCVMRLLSSRYRQFGLDDLGMHEADLQKVSAAAQKPYGMILATGPTGSGKTTMIYSILKTLNKPDRNIATIEDPVEYEIEGVSQIQVNPKTNLTFAEGLRTILRQDPNIIYVGEIRDDETAGIAVNSAMTGHLVLSTLHTNDAATALPRLFDMGVEPFLVASTANIVIAQRLVRKICNKCRVSQIVGREELTKHFPESMVQKYFKSGESATIFAGKGCSVCRGTGYAGRVGIFEVLVMSEKLQELTVAKADADKVTQQAIAEGMTTMLEDGLLKVQEGITTVEEVIRVTRE